MKKKIAIALIVLMFIGTLGYLALKGVSHDVVYETISLQQDTIRKRTMATGTIVPRKEVEIKPQSISGIIEEIYVEEGQLVKKGDEIAKIAIVPNEVNLNGAVSRLNMAKITFQNAEVNYNRDLDLLKKEVIARLDFEKTELAYQNAREELKAAQNNLQLIRTGASSSQKSSNTLIRSTIDGMVLNVPVKIGNSVIASNNFNDGTTIASVADMGEIIFEGKIDETDVAKLYLEMPIELTIGAIENQKVDAVLEHISPKGEEENGAVKFEIKAKVLVKEGQKIRAGYSANADIVLEKRENVPVLKERYLIFREDSTFVEVLTSEEPQVFEERYIKIGLSDGLNIEILSGVEASDRIKAGIKEDKN